MKKEAYARMKIFTLFCAAIISAATFVEKAQALSYGGNITVSPMPFRPGDKVEIAAVSGEFKNVTMLVLFTDGTRFWFERYANLGSVAKGATVKHPWQVGPDLQADSLALSVIFLEGDEVLVGEPGTHPFLKLVARCRKPAGGIGRAQCTYATAKYWITTTKQN